MSVRRYCSTWDGEAWCPGTPTTYVYSEPGPAGGSDDGSIQITGSTYETLCDPHADVAKTRRRWVWSRPLGMEGDA